MFIYELAIPETKFLLLKNNQRVYPTVGIIEALFIFAGIAFLIYIWNALQDYIGDMTSEKIHAPEPEKIDSKIDQKTFDP